MHTDTHRGGTLREKERDGDRQTETETVRGEGERTCIQIQ